MFSAVPANAEGYWSSYIGWWTPPKETRSWYDGNADAVGTDFRIQNCAGDASGGAFYNATFKLMREIGGLPDENKGSRTSSQWFGWGDVQSSNYHLTMTGINVQGTYLYCGSAEMWF